MNPIIVGTEEVIRNPSFISVKSANSSASSILNESLSTCSQDSSYSSQCFGSPQDKNDINLENASYVPLRYRGFTTSISHLFSDETVVCTSMSCFGILLSLRTEHLLSVRNARMSSSTSSGRGRKRSWIMGISFLATIVFIMLTYLFWGRESTSLYNSTLYSSTSSSSSSTTNYNNDNTAAAGIGMIYYWHNTFTNIFNNLLQTTNIWQDLHNNNDKQQRHLSNPNSSPALTWHNGTRIIILLIFLLFLGTVGRRRRMRTRYKILQARAQDDLHVWISNWRVRKILANKVVDEGTCAHLLCGCYGVDVPHQESNASNTNAETTKLSLVQHQQSAKEDLCQVFFKHFNACCCGVICKCWLQLFSICTLAQEAREVKTLLPMRYQQVDYITHENFESYHKRMVILRQENVLLSSSNINDTNIKTSATTATSSSISLMAHFRGFSHLTQHILLTFFFLIILVIATLELNPTSSFGIHDALLLCATFGVSFILLFVAHWLFHKSDLTLDAVIKFYAAGFLIAAPTAMILESIFVAIGLLISYTVYGILYLMQLDTIIDFIMNYYFYIWIVMEIIYCYIGVAVIEELCKYYVFRAVEHPDLIFLTDLLSRTLDMEISWDRKYKKKNKRRRNHNSNTNNSNYHQDYEDDDDDDYPAESRNVRQMAAAITVAMISVAVGLACAENFCYVFFISGLSSTKEKFALLVIRSLFPMHALCSAMQSINVIWRFIIHLNTLKKNNSDLNQINNNNVIGVGTIITSSVIFHGTYDTILFLLSVYTMYYQMNAIITLLSWILVSSFFILGLCHYYRQNRFVRDQLIDIVLSEANRKLEVELQKCSRNNRLAKEEEEDDDDRSFYRNIVTSPSEITMDDPPTAVGDDGASTTFSVQSSIATKPISIGDTITTTNPLQEEYYNQKSSSSPINNSNENDNTSSEQQSSPINNSNENDNTSSEQQQYQNMSYLEQAQQPQQRTTKKSPLTATDGESHTVTSTTAASTKGSSLLFKSWLPFGRAHKNTTTINTQTTTKMKKSKKSKIKSDEDNDNEDTDINNMIGSYKNPDLIQQKQKLKDDINVWV